MNCLSIDPNFCAVSTSRMTLQFGPSLKQDQLHHAFPPLSLERAPNDALCPVQHAEAYLVAMCPLHSTQAFSVTMVPPHGAAA